MPRGQEGSFFDLFILQIGSCRKILLHSALCNGQLELYSQLFGGFSTFLGVPEQPSGVFLVLLAFISLFFRSSYVSVDCRNVIAALPDLPRSVAIS